MDVPLLILAGSDAVSRREANDDAKGRFPEFAHEKALMQIEGRSLLEWSLQSFSSHFEEILVGGPHKSFHWLRGRLNVRSILDYGPVPVGTRLIKALKAIAAGGHHRVMVTTCDILPSCEDIANVIDRYQALRASDDVALFLRYSKSETTETSGKHTYSFRHQDGTASRGLLAHLWTIDSARLRLPLIEWCVNACCLRRCPVRVPQDEDASRRAQVGTFVRRTRETFCRYLYNAWKHQVSEEGFRFTYRYALTVCHAIRYVMWGLDAVASQEAVLQLALMRAEAFDRRSRQIAIELLDIPSLAFVIDHMQDAQRIRQRHSVEMDAPRDVIERGLE